MNSVAIENEINFSQQYKLFVSASMNNLSYSNDLGNHRVGLEYTVVHQKKSIASRNDTSIESMGEYVV